MQSVESAPDRIVNLVNCPKSLIKNYDRIPRFPSEMMVSMVRVCTHSAEYDRDKCRAEKDQKYCKYTGLAGAG
jgi:hypothetical protein